MTWGEPTWLWALPVVLLLAAIVAMSAWLHRSRLEATFSGAVYQQVLPLSVRARRTVRDLGVLGGLGLAVIALAEPQLGERVFTIEQKGVDIVLAVDLSRSMNAKDVDPSRLERARREILDLLEVLEGDRVGMVIYAGGAYPRMPLTQDHDALRMLVAELDTATFQAQGSELGLAIRQGLELLGTRRGDAGQAILVLSDGEVHRPADALAAAAEAAARDVRIFALGIGREAAPIPAEDGTWLTDISGQTVLTVPDTRVLSDVARATGGAYVQSVASADDVERLYRQEMRGRMRAGEQGTVQRKVSESAYQWPLGLGVLLLLGGLWLGEGHRRWGAALGRAAVVLLLFLPLAASAATRAEGDEHYRSGRYQDAIEVFTELTMQNPTDPDLWGRLAAARYRAGDAEGAARAYEEQIRLSGADDPQSLYNTGNAHYRAQRLEQALQRYDRVLELDPAHEGAARNKQLVEREIVARRQNQQKPPPQQQQQGESSEQQAQQQQQGQQQQQEGQQQQAQEQQAEQQQGQPGEQGQPQEGQQAQQREQQEGEESQDGRRGQQTGQERDEGEEPSGVANLDELQPSSEGGSQDGGAVAQSQEGAEAGGPITAAQADRLLEGIEEGRPRVVIPGDAEGGKPW